MIRLCLFFNGQACGWLLISGLSCCNRAMKPKSRAASRHSDRDHYWSKWLRHSTIRKYGQYMRRCWTWRSYHVFTVAVATVAITSGVTYMYIYQLFWVTGWFNRDFFCSNTLRQKLDYLMASLLLALVLALVGQMISAGPGAARAYPKACARHRITT